MNGECPYPLLSIDKATTTKPWLSRLTQPQRSASYIATSSETELFPSEANVQLSSGLRTRGSLSDKMTSHRFNHTK